MQTLTPSQYGIQLGKAVKMLRERQDMTQTGLQESAKLASGYISRLEAGEYTAPSIVHILKIAQAFGMNLRDFLEYAELIPQKNTFEQCLRGEGADEEQIREITKFKEYVLFTNKGSK